MLEKFIHRPVLAIVISIVIAFVGVLAIRSRPISQFPSIAPPVVSVTMSFPGASAQVLVESALIPMERSINGVPGMRYLTSDATSAGEATIQVVFEPGTDPNIAVVNVKNRVDQVMSLLPELVRLEGVVVMPVQPSMLMYVNLYSTDPTRTRPSSTTSRTCISSPSCSAFRAWVASRFWAIGSTRCASGCGLIACAPTTSRPTR